MKTRFIWKFSMLFIFMIAALCLAIQPALAGDKSKNKGKNETAVNADKMGGKSQDEIDQILAIGPPIEKDPIGYYYKVVPGNGKFLVKYFPKGHPINSSGWTYCGNEPCQPPYGQ